jgi:cyclase
MLKKRIIPIVLLDGFSVIKTIQFDARRNLGSPITVMRTYNTRNVDEIIILDIDATKNNRPIDKFIIKEITSECFMPLTLGGGIKSCFDIESLLKIGADKVSINTVCYRQPKFAQDASRTFGSQCIVASMDVIKVDGSWFPYCDKDVVRDMSALDWALKLQDLGVGELLLNDVSRDGTMSGADIELAKLITGRLNIPVIFAGGIDSPNNAADIVEQSDVAALGVSSIFHFTDYTPEDCRKSLRQRGIPAR